MADIRQRQRAVVLTGPDELVFDDSKKIFRPRPYQMLCEVEVVGLCFSDLKLLKQLSSHVRKGEIISGIDTKILADVPGYVPGKAATVPGHEVVLRIIEAGSEVKKHKTGGRYLVQADYRWLLTKSSNAAFGYNFEGGLQEYVLMDERVIISPEGESMLIPVCEDICGSAAALVEPWACVEDAYASKERRCIKEGGKMLIVAEVEPADGALEDFLSRCSKLANITWLSERKRPFDSDVEVIRADSITRLDEAAYDDIIYFGSNAGSVESLFEKVAAHGLLNIVLCGGRLGRNITAKIGRVHYRGIRIVGTTGSDPAESLEYIPETDEIRPGDKINIIGAGGPMGVMHVIRNICQGVEGISVYASDTDDDRLKALSKIVEPLAQKNGVAYRPYNPAKEGIDATFDYIAIMAPVPALVAGSVTACNKGGVINIFAGIPATVDAEIDLDSFITKQLYFIGTSGSTIGDMKLVLAKLESGRLDTNASVAAVCGLEHAIEGIRAVESRSIAGKILVYPACKGLELTKLEELEERLPEVAGSLNDGIWTKEAEKKLLEIYR